MITYNIVSTRKKDFKEISMLLITSATCDQEIVDIIDYVFTANAKYYEKIRIKLFKDQDGVDHYLDMRMNRKKSFEKSIERSNCFALLEDLELYKIDNNNRIRIKSYSMQEISARVK